MGCFWPLFISYEWETKKAQWVQLVGERFRKSFFTSELAKRGTSSVSWRTKFVARIDSSAGLISSTTVGIGTQSTQKPHKRLARCLILLFDWVSEHVLNKIPAWSASADIPAPTPTCASAAGSRIADASRTVVYSTYAVPYTAAAYVAERQRLRRSAPCGRIRIRTDSTKSTVLNRLVAPVCPLANHHPCCRTGCIDRQHKASSNQGMQLYQLQMQFVRVVSQSKPVFGLSASRYAFSVFASAAAVVFTNVLCKVAVK